MEQNAQFLERMASISPGVHLHLSGELWKQHIDEDEHTLHDLVLECFSMMIDEAFELGVEFFCSRGELCDTGYHLDRTLLLFEIIFPMPLYRSITEDDGFRTWLTSTVCDGAGDPEQTNIMNLLEYLAFTYRIVRHTYIPPENEDISSDPDLPEPEISIFQDTYQLLHDKIRSTPVFDEYVTSVLSVNTTPFQCPIDPDEQKDYLDHVNTRITRLLEAVDHLDRTIPTIHDMIELQYQRIEIYRRVSIASDTLSNNTWAFMHVYKPLVPPTPFEQAMIARFIFEQNAQVPLFEVYFRIQENPLTRSDCVSLILGCYDESSTKDVFVTSTASTFYKIRHLMPQADQTLHVFIQNVCLNLAGTFGS